MDELRWILLIVGAAVVAAVYGFTRWQENRRSARRGDAFGDDIDLDAALRDLDSLVVERDPLEAPARSGRAAARARLEQPLKPLPDIGGGLEEKVVVLNVAATDGRMFDGHELVDALTALGLRYGEHAIYHRILETRRGALSLFSAANILQPGTLEPERLDAIQSPGLALFLRLPGPYDGLVAFEQMLETARRIAERLDVKLLDERRCSLTNQAIEHIREELREYRRLAHLQAKKA